MKKNIIFCSLAFLISITGISLQARPMPTLEQIEFCKKEVIPDIELNTEELRDSYLKGRLKDLSEASLYYFDECIKEQMKN